MRIIYEPGAKAREYAPLACNLYTGCPHSCRYCYGPVLPNAAKKGLTMDVWRRQWHSRTRKKANAMDRLERDLGTLAKRKEARPVLLCFACDPYPPDEPMHKAENEPMTRWALGLFRDYGITPIILTKGGTRACRDFDILKAGGGWFGQTCAWKTGWEESEQWEPHAADVPDRIIANRTARDLGISTWWSVEPVINVAEALAFIRCSAQIDFYPQHPAGQQHRSSHFKLGKLSGYDAKTREIERSIDWPNYRRQAIRILDDAGYAQTFTPGEFSHGTYYIKRELRDA